MRRRFQALTIVLFTLAIVGPVSARTWRSRSGNEIKAEYVRFEGDMVILKRDENGEEIKIEINRFADKDRAYLEALRADESPAAATSTTKKKKAKSKQPTAQTPTKKAKNKQPTAPASAKKAKPAPSSDKLLILGVILAVLNIPIYLLLGKGIFGDFHEFIEAVRFWLTPDIISWFRGEYSEDFFGELKLGLFALLCIGAVVGEYFLIAKYILGWM